MKDIRRVKFISDGRVGWRSIAPRVVCLLGGVRVGIPEDPIRETPGTGDGEDDTTRAPGRTEGKVAELLRRVLRPEGISRSVSARLGSVATGDAYEKLLSDCIVGCRVTKEALRRIAMRLSTDGSTIWDAPKPSSPC
jgi:hypothetical protein